MKQTLYGYQVSHVPGTWNKLSTTTKQPINRDEMIAFARQWAADNQINHNQVAIRCYNVASGIPVMTIESISQGMRR